MSPSNALHRRATELTTLIHQTRAGLEIQQGGDEIERALSHVSRENSATELRKLRHELAEVEAALERVRDGSYGVCDSCGHEISAKRLTAVVSAKYCVGCKGLVEGKR